MDKERLELIKAIIDLITVCISLIIALITIRPNKKPHHRKRCKHQR